ncbi:MAG: hypothetical protein H6807_06895 [Planctomycetes bacterium]|nr:hypothetical protein [Planctomycetota bacterium]
MRKLLALVALMATSLLTGLRAQSDIEIQFGLPDGQGSYLWLPTPAGEQTAAIRVVDSTGADLDGAWVVLLTRISATAPAGSNLVIPSWLQRPANGVAASSLISANVAARLSPEALAHVANQTVMADPVLTSLYLETAFTVTDSIAEFGVAALQDTGSEVYWPSNAPYWGGGFGTMIWARSYQEPGDGFDLLSLGRLAEGAMQLQAGSAGIVRDFLRSPTYAELVHLGAFRFDLQAMVILKPAPFDEGMELPGFEGLPEGPDEDDDAFLDFSIPIQLAIPIEPPSGPPGNVRVQAPGTMVSGLSQGSPVYFFTGNAVDVDTACFPLENGPAACASLLPVIPGFPEFGIHYALLPVDAALIDKEGVISLIKVGQPTPPDLVIYDDIPATFLN